MVRSRALKLGLMMVAAASACSCRGEDSIRLSVSYPPPVTTTHYKQIRIAGSCDPSCRVRVRRKQVRVYPTGAFVDLVELEEGENIIRVCAEREGREECVGLKVKCTQPLVTSPSSPLTIDTNLMKPEADTVLQPGDELRVQVKGSPGVKASWSLGNIVRDAPMEETAPPEEGALKGVAGVYRATYRIGEGDDVRGERVRFRLASKGNAVREASSPGRVTILPSERISRGVVGSAGARLSEEPGGDMVWKLDRGARVNLCGEAGDYYRVKLPGDGRYWMPKESVEKVEGSGPWAAAAVGPPVVSSARGGAQVLLPLDGKPPVRVEQFVRDGTVAVTLFGAKHAAGGGRIDGASPIVGVELESDGGESVRLIARLRKGQQWGFRHWFNEKGLVLQIKKGPGGEPGTITVVIDAGHGGAQPGAVSITGIAEKEFNLRIARALGAFLKEKGIRALLTREGDCTLSLADRIAVARERGADLFVSIHNNSRPGHVHPLSRRGSDVFFGVPQSEKLAESILGRLAEAGLTVNGCRRANFAVILPTDYPAVLVECAYLSHPEDEALLLRKGFAEEVGRKIGEGVLDFIQKSN